MDPVGNTKEKSIHLFWCFTIITIFGMFIWAPLKTAEVNICGSLSLAAAGGNASRTLKRQKRSTIEKVQCLQGAPKAVS